jgi:hypothetical protein
MAVQIQLRRGTAAQWVSANPTLAAGEVGLETDTDKFKFGDGSTTWNSLGYITPIANQRKTYSADHLRTPDNSDWAVSAPALASSDPDDPSLTIRRFDDTIEQGIGILEEEIPASATNIKLYLKSRAITAPGEARKVGLKFYSRGLPNNAAVEDWSSGTQWNDLDMPVNAYPQYDSEQRSLSSLSITAGRAYLFECTRVAPSAGTNLSGDWALITLGVEYN